MSKKTFINLNRKAVDMQRKLLLVFCLLFLTGCASSNTPGISGPLFRQDISQHKDWPEDYLNKASPN